MSISRWQNRAGQVYKGPICTIEECWIDLEAALKHDHPEMKEHEMKLCKDVFYSAFGSVCLELNAFGFDPEAVGLALGLWAKEHGHRTAVQMDRNDLTAPMDEQMTKTPSKN